MLADTDLQIIETRQESDRPRRGPLRPHRLLSTRKRRARRLAGHWFRVGDTLLVVFASAWLAQSVTREGAFQTATADVVPIVIGGWITWRALRALELYRFPRSGPLPRHVAGVLGTALIGAGAAVGLANVMGARQLETETLLRAHAVTGAVLAALHVVWWTMVRRWRSHGWLTPNVVVVGATAHAAELIEQAILDRHDVHILGIFDDRRDRSPLAVLGVPVLGDTTDLLRHRVMPFVDLVVVTIDAGATHRVRQIMDRIAVLPNEVTLLFEDPVTGRQAKAIEQLAESPLAPLRAREDDDRRAFAKRIQDVLIGTLALVLLSPAITLIALLVRLSSRGPVFFRQRRHGFNNEEIVVWKFRTMKVEATDHCAARQVTADDDRVTRIGRILRTTGLDELPQLFNVVRGDMSLVGPRPHAIGMKTGETESARLVAEYAHRHRIKPGMTGWAAVHGSRGPLHDPADVLRRVALDVEYIDRQSFWLDVRIMLRTLPSLLGDRSAVR